MKLLPKIIISLTTLSILVACDPGPKPKAKYSLYEAVCLRPIKLLVLVVEVSCYSGDPVCKYKIRIVTQSGTEFYYRNVEEESLEKLP